MIKKAAILKNSDKESNNPDEVIVRRDVVTLESGEITSTTVVFKKNIQITNRINDMEELLLRQKGAITSGDVQSSLESNAIILQMLESLREDFQKIESDLLESLFKLPDFPNR